jgi:hypothetical protein
LALVLAAGSAGLLVGCSSAAARPASSRAPVPTRSAPTVLSVVVRPVRLEFVTAAGASSQLPTRPLSAGDRVVGRDDILQLGAVVGHDLESCTVGFELQVLCDDMLSLDHRGDLHATWTFQWPATGTSGPPSFDGVIDGGTEAFRNAAGDFHAVALSPGQDLRMTATLTP